MRGNGYTVNGCGKFDLVVLGLAPSMDPTLMACGDILLCRAMTGKFCQYKLNDPKETYRH
jgi:hypothetical protein